MSRSRTIAALGAAALVAAALAAPAGASTSGTTTKKADRAGSYLVLVEKGADANAVATRLRAEGAKVTSVNTAIGMVMVTSDDANFRADGDRAQGVQGVAAERSIGRAPVRKLDVVEREHVVAAKAHQAHKSPAHKGHGKKGHGKKAKADPLDDQLWGMDMIDAPEAHKLEMGSKHVKVGIMDTGVQADHPDIHPNFDYRASRNFTTDIPAVDGPCEVADCVDPVGEDDNGHGTHVSGTIAAAMNDFGVSGVAPKVDIVEVRAGQDSGYFFGGPTINALTYSGDAGIDVVNMSFYVDPWLYNCTGGAPEDTPAQAADQDVIIAGVTRALEYAHSKDVTLVAALGNEHDDIASPRDDLSSPDYGEDPHTRTIDNSKCLNLPLEGPDVLGVSALGPSGDKADFSNWTEDLTSDEIEVSAPGGYYRDGFGTDSFQTNENLILSSVSVVSLQDTGEVDADGNITALGEETGVRKECQARPARGTTPCGYFAWYQGTSMATPHAVGVAALAVSAHGRRHGRDGFGMSPDAVRRLMMRSATDHACPPGGVMDYTNVGRSAEFTATCVGSKRFNGFYGDGIVNALGVVR